MAKFLAFKVSRALIARILFAIHGIIGVWRLYTDTKIFYYWLFALAPIILFIEGAITILWRHGDEYKWFCPSVFIFLCGSVPPIWLLELTTTIKIVNNHTVYDSDELTEENEDVVLAGYLRVLFPALNRQKWLQLIEQSLLVILILGRWLLPKGRITRDELSQLLMAYLAISADIVELFNLFNEPQIRRSIKLSVVILTVWSVSLVQFPMVLTTVKGQKARYCWPSVKSKDGSMVLSPSINVSRSSSMSKTKWSRWSNKLTDISAWGIMSTVLLQDGPFFALRIYLIFWEDIFSYTMFFFISKNSLIIMVQLYRLMVICCDTPSSMASASGSVTVDDVNQNIALNAQERWHLLQRNGSMGSNSSTPKKLIQQLPPATPKICSSDLTDL